MKWSLKIASHLKSFATLTLRKLAYIYILSVLNASQYIAKRLRCSEIFNYDFYCKCDAECSMKEF